MSYCDGDMSRSYRAEEAESRGVFPASRVCPGISAADVRAVYGKAREWHHTGSQYRATDYYDRQVFFDCATSANGRRILGHKKLKRVIDFARAIERKSRVARENWNLTEVRKAFALRDKARAGSFERSRSIDKDAGRVGKKLWQMILSGKGNGLFVSKEKIAKEAGLTVDFLEGRPLLALEWRPLIV